MTANENAIGITDVRFPALDGYELGGTLFEPAGDDVPKQAAVFNCGGGVPAARYRRFAGFLASRGIAVVTYDYRGIGKSRSGCLKGFVASAEDWSEFDTGGAISLLSRTWPKAEFVGIAHSIGALIMGGAPNIGQLKRFVFVAGHTGYFADYRPRYRIPMALLWHGLMPLLTRLFGYFPGKALGLGEDLPPGIAMQWAARWSPDFRPEATAADARRARAMLLRFPNVGGRLLALTSADDAFATASGQNRLLRLFPNIVSQTIVIQPEGCAMPRIGHFGYFRHGLETAIWQRLVYYIHTGELPVKWLQRADPGRTPGQGLSRVP
jgi:predicted alpha/beta hydrolase